MSGGFLYYVPRPAVSRVSLCEFGLGYLLEKEGPGPSVTTMSPGPDERPGSVFSIAGLSGKGGADPSLAGAAKWSKIPGGEAWLGLLEGDCPGPEDLARAERFKGHEVLLADGRRWLIPVARLVTGGTRLRRALRYTGSGWTKGEILEPYRRLFDDACRVYDALVSDEKCEMDVGDAVSIGARAIACNYRIGVAEISELGLLDEGNLAEVLRALIDYPALMELAGALGKALAAGPSSGPGGAA